MAEHELNKIVDDDGEVFNLRDSTKQPVADRVTAWGSTPSDTKYPSEKLVKDSLDGKQATLAFDGTYNASTNKAATVSTVTNAISGLDVSSVGGSGKYISAISEVDGKISATATTMDTTPTASSQKAVTSGGVKTALDGKVANFTRESQFFWDNTFCSGMMSGPGIVSIHDGFFCLDKRDYNITITKTIEGVDTDLSQYASHLFNLYQDDYSFLRFGGGTIKIEIERKTAGTYVWAECGYPYGTFRIYHYAAMPASCTMRVKTNYPSQIEPGWHSLTVNSSTNGYQFWATNNYYNVEKLEIIVDATNLTSTSTVSPVILVFVPFRPNTSKADSHPVIRKYGAEKLYFPLTAPEFIGDLNGKFKTARKLAVSLSNTSTDTSFDGSADVTNIKTTGTLDPGNGGTGKTTLKAAEYNLTTGKSEISDTTSGDDRVVFELASPSESNGVTRGFRKLSTIWTWVKGQISSVLGLSESGYSGNAATATKATQDSDGNAINATYFKSSGNTTLVAGAATKIGTQNGADVKLTLPAHQDISGKMNTSASNATAPSSSGGDGATATLLNNLTDGNSDIATTDDGDNVLIATTDNRGTVTNKWYKRKIVKLIPWIIKKLGTGLVYDCGAGSTSGDDFDAALAAFNAGQWVIIRKDGIAYYCVGSYSGPGLRFKQIANDGSLLKVNTISWTRGSSPSAVTQIEASLSGHTHSQYLTASDITGKMATDCSNKASGALQNLTGQLTEGTSDFTDNTEIFTSYAGNSGFAEAGHVNQPYRRKASSMLNYIADSGLAQLVQVYGNSVKKIEIGYATIADTGNSSEMKALVELTCVSQSSTSQPGSSMLMLVSVSCTNTYRFAKATILENTFWDGRTRPVIVTKVVSNRMYVYVGLLANNGTSLVSFDYTYAKITRIGHVNNWSWEHKYTSDGTFDHIFYCDDSVKFVPTVNSNTIGATAGIASGSPADACVTYWSAMQPGCIRMVYNQNGTEYTILFSKSSDGKYGSILKWSYTDNYMRIIRIQNNSVLTGADWVKISAGYADSAGSLSSSVSVGSANQPVYFNNGSPTVCNWWVS